MEEEKLENEENVFEWLDELRESGDINMFGAVPYISDEFQVDRYMAKKYLARWMKTFSVRHPDSE